MSDRLSGLTFAEVNERVAAGKTNRLEAATSRRARDIVFHNVFTLFNALLGALLLIILVFGSAKDALFGFVILFNTLIGIVQEFRAKRTLDRLYLVTAPKTQVVREGAVEAIPAEQVVLDDLVRVEAGDQIVADGLLVRSEGLEVDESLLTGESVPVKKTDDDQIFAGSFAVAGAGLFQATKVGPDSYAQQFAAAARRFHLSSSELRESINTLLRWISWILIPLGALLVINQLRSTSDVADIVSGTVAGLVGVIPQGLILLTSIAFALAVIRLGRRNALMQELPAVEVLARVDTLCIDKTGTLTEPNLVFDRLVPLLPETDFASVLAALCDSASTHNATFDALAEAFDAPPDWTASALVPFSSARKWSGATFASYGTWVLGAPEIVMEKIAADASLRLQVRELAETGVRVLLLARGDGELEQETLPDGLQPAALVVLEEKIRDDASEILDYFATQHVTVKVLSGDNPNTVAAVARRVGLRDAGQPIDARDLAQGEQVLSDVMERTTIFGRVSPDQKKDMVAALQAAGHVVAMTGDGVNDVLALKQADLGIAMGSGSAAAKAVAQLILTDGRFASLPWVVGEGRRVIANIERVANLFLTKTTYIMLLIVAVAIAGLPFPLLPRDLTVIDAVTIGIPAFFLALAPNATPYKPGFMSRVLRFVLPVGTLTAIAVVVSYLLQQGYADLDAAQSRMITTFLVSGVGIWILLILARPLTSWRVLLVLAMVGLTLLVGVVPFARQFFDFTVPPGSIALENVLIAVVAVAAIEIANGVVRRRSRS
jgi:cation-transporting ATPase E